MNTGKTAMAVALTALLSAALVAGCGDDDNDARSSSVGNGTDVAFVADMVPHHEGAIEMAELARERAEHAEIRRLAEDIVSAQQSEISVLTAVGRDLQHMGSTGGHMGMDEHAMGMDADMPMLRGAEPFDRAFIDMMIPHHQGAVRMARQQLAKGQHPQLRRMAREIVAAQSREIAQMRKWRERWYE
jgi:uncharacterized protein (DUF305 family)